MLIQKNNDILSSEITSESQYLKRRQFLKAGAVMGAGSAIATAFPAAALQAGNNVRQYSAPNWLQGKIVGAVSAPDKPHVFHAQDALTPYEAVASYNNFYEFGTGKSDPAQNSANFITDPWGVKVSGEAELTGRYNLEDLLAQVDIEERVYRLRCVEAWSMVVPWLGFPLASLLQRFKPTSKAKYVEFKTLLDKRQMPGQKSRTSVIKWPYVEGLRIDEAMHPLTFVAIGLYGKSLPPQNGAPLRLVVPWKYGFKSIKSIVSIKFTSRRPKTSWQSIAPGEYGFYANVNPKVNHPRWSQAVERRLPSSLFKPNRVSTQLFNGYGEQVASLYQGMNLRRFY